MDTYGFNGIIFTNFPILALVRWEDLNSKRRDARNEMFSPIAIL